MENKTFPTIRYAINNQLFNKQNIVHYAKLIYYIDIHKVGRLKNRHIVQRTNTKQNRPTLWQRATMKQLYKNINEFINQRKTNTSNVCVFLKRDQYKKFIDLKYKYRLSISVITQIIYINYVYNPTLNKILANEQFYKTTKDHKKTTIKIDNKQMEKEELNKGKFINNCLIVFIDKLEKNYISQKETEKIRQQITNCFQNTIDPFFNYNENYRQFYFMKEHAK